MKKQHCKIKKTPLNTAKSNINIAFSETICKNTQNDTSIKVHLKIKTLLYLNDILIANIFILRCLKEICSNIFMQLTHLKAF